MLLFSDLTIHVISEQCKWMLVFSRFILGFNDTMLSVLDDVFVDNEMPMVTLSILRFVGPIRFFRGSHKGGCVCVRL
jgi:hypothetical protein